MNEPELTKRLSKVQGFADPKLPLEQYMTDPASAARLLLAADAIDGIAGRRVLDLGAGTGMLGIGCLALGAQHVTFLEIDRQAIAALNDNLARLGIPADRCTVRHEAVHAIDADLVVMNPPFGAQLPGHDRAFLRAALESAPVVYSMHNAGSEAIIDLIARQAAATRTHTWDLTLRIPKTYEHQQRQSQEIAVLAVRLARQ